MGMRQNIFSLDAYTSHIPSQTDSFVLYIKAMTLVSKAKEYNTRYGPTFSPDEYEFPLQSRTIRSSPAFKEVNEAILSFAESFPKEHNDIMKDGRLDMPLYMALSLPNTCVLQSSPGIRIDRIRIRTEH